MSTSIPGTDPSTPCPSCGKDARLAPNPYYGTGLSVHPHVVTCTHCGRLGFAPRPDSRPADDAETMPVDRGPWRRLTAWLGAA